MCLFQLPKLSRVSVVFFALRFFSTHNPFLKSFFRVFGSSNPSCLIKKCFHSTSALRQSSNFFWETHKRSRLFRLQNEKSDEWFTSISSCASIERIAVRCFNSIRGEKWNKTWISFEFYFGIALFRARNESEVANHPIFDFQRRFAWSSIESAPICLGFVTVIRQWWLKYVSQSRGRRMIVSHSKTGCWKLRESEFRTFFAASCRISAWRSHHSLLSTKIKN